LVRVAYLYHGRCPKTGRAVVALFYLDRRERGEGEDSSDDLAPVLASLIVADPKSRKGDRPPAMKRLFEMATQDAERLWKGLRVEKSETKATEAEALTSAGASLAQYASEKRGPTLVIVESCAGASELRRTIPQLGDFANLDVAFRSDDGRYPRLGWQSWVCRRVCERVARVPQWLEERQAMARYANVPLGSLGASPLTRAADALFARSLKQHRHLLWASEASGPDLGDDEGEQASFDDDGELPLVFRDFAPVGSSYAKSTSGRHEDVASTSAKGAVECPGTYRSVCARIDVFGAAVNAVMVSDDLAGDGALGDSGYQDQDCAHAFRILRALLAEWVDDVSKRRSEHADALLVHLDRWLRDRSSILHHPQLRRLVQTTTKRVRSRLVADLRRLGLRVVHAGESEVIVATRETDPTLAAAHLEFVSQTIAARPVFRYLHLKPRAFYASLLYLDARNFGAIEVLDGDEDMTNEEGEERLPVHDRFVSQWDLAIELPPVAVDWFNVLVGAFLHKPLKARTGNVQQDEHFTQNFVETFTSQKLMPVVAELQRDYHGTSTALDFVVLVGRALALDESVEEETHRARRLLLAQLGTREFDPKAQIKARPTALDVSGVACPYCDAVLDVDVAACSRRGRADDLHNNVVHEEDEEPPSCLCERCGGSLPSSTLEASLLETVDLCRTRWLSQDLRCKRCKRVCREECATHCPCSGVYETDIDSQKFEEYLAACAEASRYYKFEALEGKALALVDECQQDVQRRLKGEYHVA